MNNSLLDCNLTEDNYDEYIDKVFNIFRLSNKRKSIILDLKIENTKCLCKLKIVSLDGDVEEFDDVSFKCNDAFYNIFLDKLIKRLNDNEDFIINDIVNLDKDDLVTLRLISKNNDLISISNLSYDKAKYLKDLFSKDEVKKEILIKDNKGKSNIKMFILMLIVLVVAFIIIVTIAK